MSPTSRVDTGEVSETIRALYRALGNRAAFDAHLDPEITIWESDAPELIEGLAGLDALRDERAARSQPGGGERDAGAAEAAAPISVGPEDITVDRWGDVAAARFVLRARYADAEDETFRVTDVFTRSEGRWRIVHHHAERHPPALDS